MESRITTTTSSPTGLDHCVITLRGATRAVVSLWVGVLLCNPIPEASALPTVDELMQELHLSDSDREKVRHGSIVDWSPSEVAVPLAVDLDRAERAISDTHRSLA
jgi:hypothetical protein